MYYDDYYSLPSRVSLTKLETNPQESSKKTAKALLELADIDTCPSCCANVCRKKVSRWFPPRRRNWDEAASLSLAISWTTKFDRALVLTPSNRDADKVREVIGALPATQDHILFDAAQLEASKKSFTQAGSAIAVLANRYDGIDLIGDECRYLIIYDLPESTNLQERFIISRLGASVLFQVRIRTRITQAVIYLKSKMSGPRPH